jgi:ABC-type antimicrobial peptide transport system permease subunit
MTNARTHKPTHAGYSWRDCTLSFIAYTIGYAFPVFMLAIGGTFAATLVLAIIKAIGRAL